MSSMRCASRSRTASVEIVRAHGSVTLPGATPAHRGHEPLPLRLARRRGAAVPLPGHGEPERYVRRVSGPLLDRLDLRVVMPRLDPGALVDAGRGVERRGRRRASAPPG